MRLNHVLSVAAALVAAGANAATVTNGGFELGSFTPPAQATMTLNPGSTAITGWQVVNDSLAWIGVGNPWGLNAHSGSFFLDLSDYSAGAPFGGIQQVLPTSAGTQYEVAFYLGSSNFWGRPASLTVSAAGSNATFVSPLSGTDDDWELHTMAFTAIAETTTLSFIGASGVNYIGLDDVSVSAASTPPNPTPEPATIGLALAGLCALGYASRRKSSRVQART